MKSKAVKKILAVGLAAAMTAGMLAGCGGDKDERETCRKRRSSPGSSTRWTTAESITRLREL